METHTEVLSKEISTLLTDQECGRISIRAKIVGADRQVNTFQVLSSVDIQTLVDDTALFTGLHRASTERVPCSLDMVYQLIQRFDFRMVVDVATYQQSSYQ